MRRARILKAAQIRLGDVRALGRQVGNEPVPGTTSDAQIEVALRRTGDLVEAIEVTCPCGRTSEVECLYDALETEDQTEPTVPVQEE